MDTVVAFSLFNEEKKSTNVKITLLRTFYGDSEKTLDLAKCSSHL